MSASVITIGALAAQTVSTIQHSHDLYTSIKDAPEHLRSLLEELQLLSRLLTGFDKTVLNTHNASTDGLVTALAYCRDALDSIQAFSTDLENSIHQAKGGLRQWAAFKVTFSEKKLKHITTVGPRKFEISPPVRLWKPNGHFVKTSHGEDTNLKGKLRRRKDTTRYKTFFGVFILTRIKREPTPQDGGDDLEAKELVFRPYANRFLDISFSLLSEGSFGAWRYSLRIFRTFSTDDPIYICCVMGNLSGVKDLFSEKKASPFDVTRDGFSLLHIAAAFGNADICRLLLAEGADADAASNSEWASENLRLFEAGTKTKALLPYCNDLERSEQEDRSTGFLDTIRVLVENGGDPMASNTKGDTALHLHTGETQQFEYLLQQEQFVTDCTQLSYDGDTIAERHARWWWSQGPVRARLALEHENTQRGRFCKDKFSNTPPFPITSRTLLLHETARHLRHFFIRDVREFESALQLVQILLREGIGIHSIDDERLLKNTPMTQIKTIASEVEISLDGLERESQITNFVLHKWLRTLEESGVNLEQYFREEQRLIQTSGMGCQWERYMFDDTWEYRVDWDLGNTVDCSSCSIAVRYNFRPAVEEEGKIEVIEDDWVDVPGAWIEEK
ncbi:MAG: hypothetical protein Q9184_001814 [Pyrenodesmia sp. 2 TL-2023]